MATTRIFDIQSFKGWEADDKSSWPANSFYTAKNVEIRKDLWCTYLSSWLVDTWRIFDDNISCMVNLETLWVSWGWIIVCLENGKVYKDWVLKETITSSLANKEVIWIWVAYRWDVQYIYYISKTYLWTWLIHRSDTDCTNFSIGYRDFTSSVSEVSDISYVINDWGLMYFTSNNYVFSLDTVDIVKQRLELPENEEIVWLTRYQNKYRVYANASNLWILYLWDWYDEFADDRQTWENQPILWVVNDWAYDYAVLWFNKFYSDLYLISWIQKQKLRVNLKSNNDARKLNWFLSIRQWIIYIWGGRWNDFWLFTYGNYYPWTPKGLVMSNSTEEEVAFHVHSNTKSYISTVDDKVYTIDHNNPPTNFSVSWEIETLTYEWISWEELQLTKVLVWYELNTSDIINIYYRTEFGGTWVLLKSITDKTKKRVQISPQEIIQKNMENFTEIMFKIELIMWVTNESPKIKRLTAFMDVINNND